MFAQSVAEYGALASFKSQLQVVTYSIRDWIGSGGPGMWLAVGAIALGALWLWTRRPSRS